MERRKFMLGMGAVAAGGAAALGTGAFSQAKANRELSVDVVSDKNAYLTLEETSPYAAHDSGELYVAFDGNGEDGTGMGKNSSYLFNDVFEIRNQGTEDDIVLAALANVSGAIEQINLFDSDNPDHPLTYPDPNQHFDNLNNKFAPKPSGSSLPSSYPRVDSGGSVSVGMDFRVYDESLGQYDGNILIIAVKDPN